MWQHQTTVLRLQNRCSEDVKTVFSYRLRVEVVFSKHAISQVANDALTPLTVALIQVTVPASTADKP